MPNTDKDLPLRNDTRLLGRLLGDTVREQEGEDVFAVIERIRKTSVELNQNPDRDSDPASRSELEAILNDLPRDSMISVVRAFSYFLHLANIAEDQHHIRRRRAHDLIGSLPREGSLQHALDRVQEAGVAVGEIRDFLMSLWSRRCLPRIRPKYRARVSCCVSTKSLPCSTTASACN